MRQTDGNPWLVCPGSIEHLFGVSGPILTTGACVETATPLASAAGRGVASVTSSPGGARDGVSRLSACSVANAGSEAEPSRAAGHLAFTWLSARVRISRGWQTIWETSGGRTSRRPPAAQVSARTPPTFLLPGPVLASAAFSSVWQSRWSARRWGAEPREPQAARELGRDNIPSLVKRE